MKLSGTKVRSLSRQQGESLSEVLRRAGVSRTAYYSLVRRDSVLPKTILALAAALGVPSSEILESTLPSVGAEHQRRLHEARAIVATSPDTSFENVWHALCLLDLAPTERLNRSLIRGRATAIHR